jgi:hypothetical protein
MIEDDELFHFVKEDNILKRKNFIENFVGFLKINENITDLNHILVYIKENYEFATVKEILNLIDNISYLRTHSIIKSYSVNQFLDSIELRLKKYALRNENLPLKALQYKKLKKAIKGFDLSQISFF